MVVALTKTSVAIVLVIFALSPLAAAVMAWILIGERVRNYTWIAIGSHRRRRRVHGLGPGRRRVGLGRADRTRHPAWRSATAPS